MAVGRGRRWAPHPIFRMSQNVRPDRSPQILTDPHKYQQVPTDLRRCLSVRKRPGRPADNRPAFSPARPGLCETDLGFVGQALGKPAGFMGAWRRRQAFGIFHVRSEYFVVVWVISEDARRYLKMPADIRRCPQISEDACRYLKMPTDTCKCRQISEDAS